MKSTAIVSVAIAASLGLGSLAQADTRQQEGGQDNGRQGWQHSREQRSQAQGEAPHHRQHDGYYRDQGQRQGQPYQERIPRYQQPYSASQDQERGGRYEYGRQHQGVQAYGNRHYYGHDGAPRYVSGGYLPRYYMAHNFWVNDWRARRLAPPPYGYQWVQTDTGDLILVALATGLIANVLLSY